MREEIMTIKYILAVALITPLLTVSSMAQQYVGGPKSGVAPTTRQISSGGDIYAQGDVYARGVRTNKSHAYRGGPKTVVPQADMRRYLPDVAASRDTALL